MTEKKCIECGLVKLLDLFRESKSNIETTGGRTAKCRECLKIYDKKVRKRRMVEEDGYKEKQALLSKKWVQNNPKKRAEIARKRNLKARKESPEKVRARELVNQRVRFKRIPKASELECTECGGQAQEYHHHLGYAWEHRYDVQPVCRNCHRKLDVK